MEQKRLNKEKVLQFNSIKVSIGTTNFREPKGFYIEYRFFVKPTSEYDTYKHKIFSMERSLRNNIVGDFCTKCGFLSNRSIVALNTAYEQMELDKPSYMTIQIVIKQKGAELLGYSDAMKIMEDNIKWLTGAIVSVLTGNGFVIYQK